MRVKQIMVDEGGYFIDYYCKGGLIIDRITREVLWNKYIVPNSFHITGDGEEYEMNEFFTDCAMIAEQLLIKWIKTSKNCQ